MKRIILFSLICLLILLLFTGCPELFKDMEYAIIQNKSDYTIVVFVDNEYKNIVAPGVTYKFGLYTKVTYTLLCRADPYKWGPKKIILKKGEPYTWVIKNPPEATPVPTIKPTPEPTPIPNGEITINNLSSSLVIIYFAGNMEGTIEAGNSENYTKEIGNYNLLAIPQRISGTWDENIDLSEEGYIWNLETEIESYPADNCRVWNFENNYQNQYGVDDWDTKDNCLFDSSIKKIGNYSIKDDNSNDSAHLQIPIEYIIGESQSVGFWLYVSYLNSGVNTTVSYIYWNGANHIWLRIREDSGEFYIRLFFYKGMTGSYVDSDTFGLNEWHYIAMSYDADNEIGYLIVDNNKYSLEPSGTWDSLLNSWHKITIAWYSSGAYQYRVNMDELCIVANLYIQPGIWVQHYNHNVPWGEEYIP